MGVGIGLVGVGRGGGDPISVAPWLVVKMRKIIQNWSAYTIMHMRTGKKCDSQLINWL